MSEGRQWIGDGLSGISTNGGGIGVAERVEDRMLTLLKRHEVQTLLAAGHDQIEVAVIAGVSVRSVRRIAAEPAVEHVDDSQERVQRRIGRPSKVEPFRALVQELVEQVDEETHAPLKSVEILRRARLDGYRGGKSALYELIAELRPHATRLMMRFEGLPGEFSQHDFGEVRITYLDGSRQVVRFFCSRLKWSRWAVVDLVPNQVAETLIRTLADHFVAFGGVPLCAVFDRPKTVALKWAKNGEVTEWNPTFAYAALELGFTAEVCWPRRANQKGSIENLVGCLYQDHVHIVAGRFQARHPRYVAKGTVSRQPEHRAAQLAAISGKRGRRYLQREHLLETGEAALLFLTELVHRDPRSWFRDAELLHELLRANAAQRRYGRFFSATDLICMQRALTAPGERACAPSQGRWR